MKKKRENLRKKMGVEKEKIQLDRIDMEEERRTWSQYAMQSEEKRSIRKDDEFDMLSL